MKIDSKLHAARERLLIRTLGEAARLTPEIGPRQAMAVAVESRYEILKRKPTLRIPKSP